MARRRIEMTGNAICRLMVEKAEQVLVHVGKQRLDDNMDATLRLALRRLEAGGTCDFETLPPTMKRLAENLVIMSTINVPPQIVGAMVRLAYICTYFTAQHYEDMIACGQLVRTREVNPNEKRHGD